MDQPFAPDRFPASLYAAATARIVVDPDGPLYDDAAQAFALDAMAAIEAGVPWNSTQIPGWSSYDVRVNLSRNGINSTDDWVRYLGDCLTPGLLGDVELIVDLRDELMRGQGRAIGLDEWLRELHQFLEFDGQDQAAHDSVDRLCPAVSEVDGWIAEAGILPAGTVLRSIAGAQVARVVTVVRWGTESGYGDPPALRQGLLAARDLAGEHFADWAEFGASVLAITALNAPPQDRRAAWDAGLPAIATLLTAAESPWRNLDFPTAAFSEVPDFLTDEGPDW